MCWYVYLRERVLCMLNKRMKCDTERVFLNYKSNLKKHVFLDSRVDSFSASIPPSFRFPCGKMQITHIFENYMQFITCPKSNRCAAPPIYLPRSHLNYNFILKCVCVRTRSVHAARSQYAPLCPLRTHKHTSSISTHTGGHSAHTYTCLNTNTARAK